jgi:hypothetical protein
MNTNEIVQQLRAERDRLNAAIQALEGGGGVGGRGKRRGRPPGAKTKQQAPAKRRTMSAAARKRIADAMKARWAAAKKSGKKRL